MKKLLSLFLSAVLLLSLVPTASAGEAAPAGDGPVRAVVRFDDAADPAELSAALAATPGVEVLWAYGLLFSGAAVEAPRSALDTLAELGGVESVSLSRRYSRPLAEDGEPLAVSNSLTPMNGDGLLARGLSGDGTVIAVLDSGLRYTHEAFRDHGLAQHSAISREDVAAFAENGGTPGRYLSPRIPFAFDYANGDDNVWTRDGHGTHVSALAVGYAQAPDGTALFRGVAPAAQLLAMKVFPDSAGAGADDAVVLRAMEDAYALGADVISLSLGSPSGFTADNSLDGLYAAIFQRLREEGVLLCCAAGNSAASTSSKAQGSPLPTGDYTDYGTVGAPATYRGAAAIAAADTMSYFAAGSLQAGERRIPFLDATAEEGAAPPPLASLAGNSFPYAAVPGLGTAADFAGLDLRGKIALVERGTIPFTEKAQNAQAAGAAACVIYNNEPGTLRAIAEGLTIPCAVISQADGAYLLGLSGGEQLTVSGRLFLASGSEEPVMLEASAWGPTSDLRFLPELTAPGGTILSASVLDDASYELQSGTSMAAPNAAGAFAILLQALRDCGVTDRAEAARLAEDLLTSTARLMAEENGTPLSPRRQGAGLLDLTAAIFSPLVVERPLLELGSSRSGQFTLTFTVRNLSQEDQVLTAKPTVLTDDYTQDGEIFYSSLAPRDITDGVDLTGPDTVTVPAGGSKKLTYTLTVGSALKKELKDIYPGGFFTEGYITLSDPQGQAVHASFLGFCGDWQKNPILEPVDFRDGPDRPVNMGANAAYVSDNISYTQGRPLLGSNPRGEVPHSDRRGAIPGFGSDALHTTGDLLAMEVYTLRNAAHAVLVVSDAATGQIYLADDAHWLHKSSLNEFTLVPDPSVLFSWAGTDTGGEDLPNGTRVNVSLYAWLENDAAMAAAYDRNAPDMADPGSYRWLTGGGYGRYLQWRFPVTVDSAAPTAKAALGEDTVEITLSDDQFLAWAAVTDGEGALLAEETFADDRAGRTHTLKLDLSGCETPPETVYITAADYATNTMGWSLDLSPLAAGERPQPERCAVALLTDVDRDAWYHHAVDFVWDAGLLSGSDLTFRPQDRATRIQVISALYVLAGRPLGEGTALPFTDVPLSADYRPALAWAWEQGLAAGYSGTVFAAYANIPRQQLAVLLHRYAALEGALPAADRTALDTFSDGGAVAPWAAEATAWAVEAGILSGLPDGTLDPRGPVTRAELAEVLMSFCEMD